MRIYLDSNILIHVVEGSGPVADVCRSVIQPERQDLAYVTSELTIAEVLVAPLRNNDEALRDAYMDWLSLLGGLTVRGVDRAILVSAAELRSAASGIRLPDAIHLATSVHEQCDVVFSDDRQLGRFVKDSQRFITIDTVSLLIQDLEGQHG